MVREEEERKTDGREPLRTVRSYQDGLEVALQKVPERREEVDGSALDELALGAADLLLRLATFHQRVA